MTGVTINTTPLNLALNESEFYSHIPVLSCDYNSCNRLVLMLQTCSCHARHRWLHFKTLLVHILTARFCQSCSLLPKLVNVSGCLVAQFKVAVYPVNIGQCCPSVRHEGSFSTFGLVVGVVTFMIQYPLTKRLCGPWKLFERFAPAGNRATVPRLYSPQPWHYTD